MSHDEYIDDQESRLRGMAEDVSGDKWDLSDNDRAACLSGADAIALVREFMFTPDFGPAPDQAHEEVYAKMRELLFRGQKP